MPLQSEAIFIAVSTIFITSTAAPTKFPSYKASASLIKSSISSYPSFMQSTKFPASNKSSGDFTVYE